MIFQKTDLSVVFRSLSLVLLLIAFYGQDLITVFSYAWSNSETSYLLAVPAMVLFMAYRKRRVLNVVSREKTSNQTNMSVISGILLFATAVFLYFYGSVTFNPLEYHMVTLPIFTAGLLLLLFNYQTLRQLVFPLFFLFFLTPPPEPIITTIGASLADISAHASATIVNALGMPSEIVYYANPTVIMSKGGQTIASFVVDFTCSGINTIITFVVFTLFLAYIVRDKLWKKAAVVVIGLPLIYILNIVRISTLLAVGYYFGVETAESLFHSFSGLILTFIGALLIVLMATKLLKANFYNSYAFKPCLTCSSAGNLKKQFCQYCGRFLNYSEAKITHSDAKKVAIIAIFVLLVIAIQVPIYALARTQTNVLEQLRDGETPTTSILPQIEGYNINFVMRDKDFELANHQDATLTYCYSPINESDNPIWVVLEIAASSSNMHRWETCLINYPLSRGYPASATSINLLELTLMDNPLIVAQVFTFSWHNFGVTQSVLYWRETLLFSSSSSVEQKSVQISLSSYPDTLDDIPKTEETLKQFGTEIVHHWEPMKTWTPVALMLTQYANILAIVTSVCLLFVIPAIYGILPMRKALKIAYSKISAQDKKIICAVRETQKTNVSTFNNIASKYQDLNNDELSKDYLFDKLEGLERMGLIHKKIASIDDFPVFIWQAFRLAHF